MSTNPYAVLHTDIEWPKTFNLKQWRNGWRQGMNTLQGEIAHFLADPSWETYAVVGAGISRMNVLKETIANIPLFLGGCEESVRKIAEQEVTAELEQRLVDIKPETVDFLESELESPFLKVRQKAKEELSYWQSFSISRAECLKVYHAMQDEEPLFFVDHLMGVNDYPALKRKTTTKAKEWGQNGYGLNARDVDAVFLMRLQDHEGLRKYMWEQFQHNAPTQQQVDKILNLRHRVARENDFNNYMEYLLRAPLNLSSRNIQKILKDSMAATVTAWSALSEALYATGVHATQWNGDESAKNEPWNTSHFLLESNPSGLPLSGKEFPLKRILNYIVPDLLSVGGWTMESEKPQRIGSKKNVMYLYRLNKDGQKALLYFAPHPYDGQSDSDRFQAYAAILREQSALPENSNIPVCIVSQNLNFENGAVTDLQQMVFLAHEIGHVLHNFSYNTHAFETFARTPVSLGELPSVLFEAMALCPTVLQKWADPKAPASNKRLKYWERRVRPEKASLLEFMTDLEMSWLDMEAHSGPGRSLKKMRSTLREEVNLPALRHNDREVYTHFDFTENAGTAYSYTVGRALRRNILGRNPTEDKIRFEMRYLLDHVLQYTSDSRIAQKWKTAYNKTIKGMFEEGMAQLCVDHAKRAKTFTKQLNAKLSKQG